MYNCVLQVCLVGSSDVAILSKSPIEKDVVGGLIKVTITFVSQTTYLEKFSNVDDVFHQQHLFSLDYLL